VYLILISHGLLAQALMETAKTILSLFIGALFIDP